jgi:hypothetical protein
MTSWSSTGDVRPESLEERRKRLARLLSRKTKAVRDGIQLSEAKSLLRRWDPPRPRRLTAGGKSLGRRSVSRQDLALRAGHTLGLVT